MLIEAAVVGGLVLGAVVTRLMALGWKRFTAPRGRPAIFVVFCDYYGNPGFAQSSAEPKGPRGEPGGLQALRAVRIPGFA